MERMISLQVAAKTLLPYTIWYDSVYLTCSKKLTGSQLSLPHGTNKKLKCETKNKTMSITGPIQSRCREGSPVGKRNLRWEGFVEKVGFEPGVKEWRSDGWRECGWWQRWADKWMRRWVETWLARLPEWIRELIPETGWCISEWSICDFQWDGWWARKGDNRWGAGIVRGLNR